MRDIETSIGAAEGRGPDRLGDEVRVSLKEPRPKVLLVLTLSCFLVGLNGDLHLSQVLHLLLQAGELVL